MTHLVRLVYLHPYMQIAQISKRNSHNRRIMDLTLDKRLNASGKELHD